MALSLSQRDHVDLFSLLSSFDGQNGQNDAFDSRGELIFLSTPHPHTHSHSYTAPLSSMKESDRQREREDEREEEVEGDDYLNYPVCSFTHVCVTPSSVALRFSNYSQWTRAKALVDDCANKARVRTHPYDLCYCFYPPELSVTLLPFESIRTETDPRVQEKWKKSRKRAGRPLFENHIQLGRGMASSVLPDYMFPTMQEYDFEAQADVNSGFLNRSDTSSGSGSKLPGKPCNPPSTVQPRILGGHFWTLHKYVAGRHHIGHWAQRIMMLASVFQHFLSMPLPSLYGLVIQDTKAPMTEHEQTMLENALWSILTHAPHPIEHLLTHAPFPSQVLLMEDIEKPAEPVCVERMSWSRLFGLFATNTHDTMPYRAVAYKRFGLTGLSHRCPPRRITMLIRHNRRILNAQEIAKWVQDAYNKEIVFVEINEKSSSLEQARLFASSGLIISAHSSQMVNVMFSHPRSSMIEITPEWYNSDFSEYAHAMGVFFRYALGGEVADPDNERSSVQFEKSMVSCLALLSECEGDSHCLLLKRFEPICRQRQTCCKYHVGFRANITAVQIAVRHAINHLNWACGELW